MTVRYYLLLKISKKRGGHCPGNQQESPGKRNRVKNSHGIRGRKKKVRKVVFSIQLHKVKKVQLYFNGPRAAENGLMYLVSAALGSYNSTNYLHFVANRKGRFEIKRKKCARGYGS